MPWYAVTPAWRARQVAADLFVLGWVVLWLLAARWVHATVLQLTRPAYGLRDASHRVDDGLDQTKARLDDVPLVGDRLRDALDPLSGATGDVDRAAVDFIAGVERLALGGALLSALLPILVVLVPWLWARSRFARRAAAARHLAGSAADLDLFALRALARCPLPALARIDPDPAAAWRSGDARVIRRLAALELASVGLSADRYDPRP